MFGLSMRLFMMVHGPRERMGFWQLRLRRRQLRRRKSKQPGVLLWMALRVRMQLDVETPAPSRREPMRQRLQPRIRCVQRTDAPQIPRKGS
jgi:hypothetical protein